MMLCNESWCHDGVVPGGGDGPGVVDMMLSAANNRCWADSQQVEVITGLPPAGPDAGAASQSQPASTTLKGRDSFCINYYQMFG